MPTSEHTGNDSLCVATPIGRGAVATIIVEGPAALNNVSKYFAPAAGKPLDSFPLNRIVFGRWTSAESRTEELVVCRRAPDVVEIHCHGGRVAVDVISQALLQDGCQLVDWRQRLRSADANAIASEALIALAATRTERTAAILLDQYRGALSREIQQIIAAIESGELESASAHLERLNQRAKLGLHLTTPWRVVLAGPANVGKSSLVNALLGFERAIVFDQPGTTRDVLSSHTAFDGWPVELSDTAGLREDGDQLEAAGISFARDRIAAADLVVLVFDGSLAWSRDDEQMLDVSSNSLIVYNKCDLPTHDGPRPNGWHVSALQGEGLHELTAEIVRRLVPVAPQCGDAIPFLPRHLSAINIASDLLANGTLSDAIYVLRKIAPSR